MDSVAKNAAQLFMKTSGYHCPSPDALLTPTSTSHTYGEMILTQKHSMEGQLARHFQGVDRDQVSRDQVLGLQSLCKVSGSERDQIQKQH